MTKNTVQEKLKGTVSVHSCKNGKMTKNTQWGSLTGEIKGYSGKNAIR
jgi:hypothetical protein